MFQKTRSYWHDSVPVQRSVLLAVAEVVVDVQHEAAEGRHRLAALVARHLGVSPLLLGRLLGAGSLLRVFLQRALYGALVRDLWGDIGGNRFRLRGRGGPWYGYEGRRTTALVFIRRLHVTRLVVGVVDVEEDLGLLGVFEGTVGAFVTRKVGIPGHLQVSGLDVHRQIVAAGGYLCDIRIEGVSRKKMRLY